MAQMGFFDLSDRCASLDAKQDPLIENNTVVPWDGFRPVLERVWRKPDEDRKSRAGRKPMDVVLMFKTLVLSALYNLSDDQTRYQVRDRLSTRTVFGPWSRGPGAGRQDGLALPGSAGEGGHGRCVFRAVGRVSGTAGHYRAGWAEP